MKQAHQKLQTSLDLRREIEDQPGTAASFRALAEVASAMGEAESAQQYQAEAQQAQASLQAEETVG